MRCLSKSQFADYSPLERLHMAIEMTSVTLDICWDSLVQTKPGLTEKEYQIMFARRVWNRRSPGSVDECN